MTQDERRLMTHTTLASMLPEQWRARGCDCLNSPFGTAPENEPFQSYRHAISCPCYNWTLGHEHGYLIGKQKGRHEAQQLDLFECTTVDHAAWLIQRR